MPGVAYVWLHSLAFGSPQELPGPFPKVSTFVLSSPKSMEEADATLGFIWNSIVNGAEPPVGVAVRRAGLL